MSVYLHSEPVGGGTVATVTARKGSERGHVLHVEKLDLARSQARKRFSRAVVDALGSEGGDVAPEAIERQLAELAANTTAPARPSTPADAIEVGDGRVVRPERFILPQVSGLAVPIRAVRGGRPVHQWQLLLRWLDGRRECVEMPETIEVDGEQVFVVPRPHAPPPSMPPGWSKAGRDGWRAGELPMAAEAVCRLLREAFGKYLDLPPETAAGTVAMLTAWTMLSYVYPVFDAVPYLAVHGPAGSGKSRVFELLSQLVLRPLSTSNISNPALFRSLDSFGGVALIDEAERLRDSRSPDVAELLSSLLAGYKRGGSATRCEKTGDGFSMQHYRVFGPKALAGIAGLPPALASRCIPVPMFRSPPGSPKPMLRVGSDGERWEMLRDALHSLAMEHGPDWLALPSRKDLVPPMSGRDFELWQPLLSLAAWLDERSAEKMLPVLQEHALRSIEASREDATPPEDEMLLRALARSVAASMRLTAGELLREVQGEDSATFRNWSPRAVANRFSRYGIRSRKSNGRHVFTPSAADLLRVQANYGIDLEIDPEMT